MGTDAKSITHDGVTGGPSCGITRIEVSADERRDSKEALA
jgi:hypothetical protein